jgi:trk system potassium uptake protein TrkH
MRFMRCGILGDSSSAGKGLFIAAVTFRTGLSRLRKLKIGLSTLILLSYLAAIGIGTAFLLLPFSNVSGDISLVDALFTATSAVCVTGLTVVDTGSYFTTSGQIIVLLLIQAGGLGIMTFSILFFLVAGKRVSFRHRMIMQEVFAHTPREDIYRVVGSIFLFTGMVEVAGALPLFLFWIQDHSVSQAVYLAVFHSISAFCNAGFALFSDSFIGCRASPLLNLTICSLIVLGGIGFPVVYELYESVRGRTTRKAKPARLSVQTRVVLIVTALLIISGMAFFLWGEYGNALRGVPMRESLWIALFQSVTSRTAGFNTVDLAQLSNPTIMVMIFLMFWGASPGSCGGGVKTTTFAVLGMFTWARLRRRSHVNVFRKSIPQETVSRSVSLLILSISLILAIFFLLLLTQDVEPSTAEARSTFVEYFFEVISAFGTVGLSMGATAKLNTFGKLLIIAMMLIGRVGVLTFAYVIAGTEARGGVQYSQQNLMIG